MPYFEARRYVYDDFASEETTIPIYRKYTTLVEAEHPTQAITQAQHIDLGEWDVTDETLDYAAPTHIYCEEVEVPF